MAQVAVPLKRRKAEIWAAFVQIFLSAIFKQKSINASSFLLKKLLLW